MRGRCQTQAITSRCPQTHCISSYEQYPRCVTRLERSWDIQMSSPVRSTFLWTPSQAAEYLCSGSLSPDILYLRIILRFHHHFPPFFDGATAEEEPLEGTLRFACLPDPELAPRPGMGTLMASKATSSCHSFAIALSSFWICLMMRSPPWPSTSPARPSTP